MRRRYVRLLFRQFLVYAHLTLLHYMATLTYVDYGLAITCSHRNPIHTDIANLVPKNYGAI